MLSGHYLYKSNSFKNVVSDFRVSYFSNYRHFGAFQVTLMIKNLPGMQERQVQSLGREDPMEKDVATLSSILAWRIPWTEEPGGLQSIGSQRVGHSWSDLAGTAHILNIISTGSQDKGFNETFTWFVSTKSWDSRVNLQITPTSLRTRRRHWRPTPVLLPRKSHGWRSLADYRPWVR